jgi:uncharacterized membrane protein YqgA involved in biofilm formation
MNGTLVNGLAIMAGSLIGIVLKTGFIKNKSDSIISVVGLSVFVIGVKGALEVQDVLLMIVSLALGFLLGEIIDLDAKFTLFGSSIEKRFTKSKDGKFAQGFVAASLLFGVGAMAIVGSFQSGLFQDETILYTKSTLDFISSIVFASSFGWGVFFSFIPVVLYQGILTLASASLSVLLSEQLITELSTLGSVMIIALGLNMMGITKFKVANLLPALGVIVVIGSIMSLI